MRTWSDKQYAGYSLHHTGEGLQCTYCIVVLLTSLNLLPVDVWVCYVVIECTCWGSTVYSNTACASYIRHVIIVKRVCWMYLYSTYHPEPGKVNQPIASITIRGHKRRVLCPNNEKGRKTELRARYWVMYWHVGNHVSLIYGLLQSITFITQLKIHTLVCLYIYV